MAQRTVKDAGQVEIVVKKSRFIAQVLPACTEEEALAFIEEIRRQHPTATHHVYAYLVSSPQQIQRFSDDGEPSGTAGRPIMELITEWDLTDLVVVVTRYFGGTLLGAGGLVRAYRQAAYEGIKQAGMDWKIPCQVYSGVIDYSYWGKIQNVLTEYPVKIIDVDYAAQVRVQLAVSKDYWSQVYQKLMDITNGEIQLTLDGETYVFSDELKPRE